MGVMNLKVKPTALAWTKATVLIRVGALVLLAAGTAAASEAPVPWNTPSSQVEPFEAYGTCTQTNFSESGAIIKVIIANFHVGVNGAKVYIRLDFAQDHYEEWTYDGTNSFCLKAIFDSVNDVKAARDWVTVTEEEFPTTAFCVVNQLWLGLASQHYFSNPTNQPVLAPWGDKGLPGAHSFQWKITRFAEMPYFPKQIIFVATDALWKKEAQMRAANGDYSTYHYREGFVGGRFEVSGTQTLNGLTYPTHFTLERYRAGKNEGTFLEYYNIVVTRLTPVVSSTFRPKIFHPTDVFDMRSGGSEMPGFSITYTLTNDAWLEKSDPRLLAFQELQKPAYENRRSVITKEIWIHCLLRIFFMVLVVGLPAIVLFRIVRFVIRTSRE